jgi:NTP pyrophosphatase (non-canonical NTP hydrolase)
MFDKEDIMRAVRIGDYDKFVSLMAKWDRGETIPLNSQEIAVELPYLVSALAGECGEACSEFAKGINSKWNGKTFERRQENFLNELSDMVFYIVALSTLFGEDIEDLKQRSMRQLVHRVFGDRD